MFTLYSHARRDSNSSSEEDESPLHPSGSSRVKRALFGPTDHEENLRFVKNELKKARNEASSRWNFDFDSGKPLNGAFEWEEVASSTAGVTVCNPEKHSFKSSSVSEEDSEEHFFKSSSGCDESEAAKENRVGGHSAGDLGQCPRESRLSEERGGDTEDGGGGGQCTTMPRRHFKITRARLNTLAPPRDIVATKNSRIDCRMDPQFQFT